VVGPLALFGAAGAAERDVVDDPGAQTRPGGVGGIADTDAAAQQLAGAIVAVHVPLQAQPGLERPPRRGRGATRQLDAVDALDRHRQPDAGVPGPGSGHGVRLDELDLQPVRVTDREPVAPIAAAAIPEGDGMVVQTGPPCIGRAGRNREGDTLGGPGPAAPRSQTLNGKERQDRPRGADTVAVVQVVRAWVVEVDRLLDQTQSQQALVEVPIALRVGGHCGDVMDSRGLHVVRPSRGAREDT